MSITKAVKLHLILTVSSLLILGSLLFAEAAQAETLISPVTVHETVHDPVSLLKTSSLGPGTKIKETPAMKSWKAIFCAMTSTLVILVTVSAATAQSNAQSQAQPPVSRESSLVCGPRDAAVAELVGDLGEQIIGRGLSHNGQAMLEVFKSETGSWTVIVTDVNGVS